MIDSDTAPLVPAGPPGFTALRNAAVFIALALALAIVRFFEEIVSPLVVAAFLLLLTDAVARVMKTRMPFAPGWVRGGLAGAAILIGFALIAVIFALEAPHFATQIRGLEPELDSLIARALALVGAPPMTLHSMFSGLNPGHVLANVFAAARGVISYTALVIIFYGFILASRSAFSEKIEVLYVNQARRDSAHRILASIRDAVERYMRLQTLKALIISISAGALMAVMGVKDALFASLLIFMATFVPLIGAFIGAIFPGLLSLAQSHDLTRAIIILTIMSVAVFIIDNVLMPKLQSDEMNIDPLLVLISIGFWGAILGAPGVLLSTPLTVTAMAIAAEFEGTRWLAILLSRDGHPFRDGALQAPGH
jgi:predicted PurR-regulated permease PerM